MNVGGPFCFSYFCVILVSLSSLPTRMHTAMTEEDKTSSTGSRICSMGSIARCTSGTCGCPVRDLRRMEQATAFGAVPAACIRSAVDPMLRRSLPATHAPRTPLYVTLLAGWPF